MLEDVGRFTHSWERNVQFVTGTCRYVPRVKERALFSIEWASLLQGVYAASWISEMFMPSITLLVLLCGCCISSSCGTARNVTIGQRKLFDFIREWVEKVLNDLYGPVMHKIFRAEVTSSCSLALWTMARSLWKVDPWVLRCKFILLSIRS